MKRIVKDAPKKGSVPKRKIRAVIQKLAESCGTSKRDRLSQHVLRLCKEKLDIYRDHSNGEYHGGTEHTRLISMINETIKILDTTEKR